MCAPCTATIYTHHIDIRMNLVVVVLCFGVAYLQCACWLEINLDSFTDTIHQKHVNFYTHTHFFFPLSLTFSLYVWLLLFGTACHCCQFALIHFPCRHADLQTTKCLISFRMYVFVFIFMICVRCFFFLSRFFLLLFFWIKSRTLMSICQVNNNDNANEQTEHAMPIELQTTFAIYAAPDLDRDYICS